MNIVKFKNGMYGVRKFSMLHLCYVYLDLTNDGWEEVWFPRNNRWFKDCRGTEERVKAVCSDLLDVGEVI